MSARLVKPRGGFSKVDNSIVHVGDCVACKTGIYSNQEWGRAPKPLLGKAHKECGGVSA